MTKSRTQDLNREAVALIRAGDPDRALAKLSDAQALDPNDPEIPMNRALALRTKGDLPGALSALDAALAIDPYLLLALFSKGAILELLGRPKDAAQVFRNALKIAPPEERLPPALQGVAAQARASVARHTAALNRFLREQTSALRAQHAGADLSRFDECLDILSGAKRAYVQEPLFLTFPKLPAITFYDRSHFDWMERLEAQTDVISKELETQLAAIWSRFQPYIDYPPGAPLNQWKALNHSPDWSSLHLWRDGRKLADNCALFPETTRILDTLPLARQPEFTPTAMFSVLQPRTTIPPHTGSSNTRLIAHLPLIIPEGCRFRVGNDIRDWRLGESFVFDDTIEHEAWNDSDEIRAVLIFDVWNPFLSEAERDLVSAMTLALKAYDSAG